MARARTAGDGDDDATPTNPGTKPQAPAVPADPAGYTVVARRYRPQRFEDVVGQDHVVQALRNAIRLDRVAQAYLFSGTRGVGKTSLARIFAKCLNCVRGPTETPCNVCDICRMISVGQDVDVIEIDGASNNGVEAVRELRQNAGLRPSRARFKVYYIDEVHMLSTGAFNALLKTLEEPPEHVKFFFATTEANKIPITVLSRCQKYDLAGIAPERIVETLAGICKQEGVDADADALAVVARRAAGSMRDAQSLLEQLLASAGDRLTVELVHRILGTASDERTLDLLEALARRDPAAALGLLDASAGAGVQPADLLSGAFEFLRDLMVLAAGAEGPLLTATPRQVPRLKDLLGLWSLDTVLAALQILAEARARLRGSPHGRILVEMALVRVARLEDLAELSEIVARLSAVEAGRVAAPAEKKKHEPADGRRPLNSKDMPASPAPPPAEAVTPAGRPVVGADEPLVLGDVLASWNEVIARAGIRLGVHLSRVKPSAVDGAGTVIVAAPARYNDVVEACESPEGRARVEAALRDVLGRPATLRFERSGPEPAAVAVGDGLAADGPPRDDWRDDPMVRKVEELFEARPVRVDPTPDSSGPGDAS